MTLFPPNTPTTINVLPLEQEFTPTIPSLKITFQNKHILVQGSNVSLSYTVTDIPPSAHDINASYSILLTDPDAPIPSDNKYAYWCHWIMAGLKPVSGPDIADETSKDNSWLKR
ncbi:hypothetical protein Clacol_005818 [Clathrus columnatus]|uniref:Uncharacterized protein n=1 Tax=Clathrus columnatus TaxID=1419009 RepID=A0AAV5ADK9_9AGAM|nr:hypothetical protein Clacol_005818 [Clathrus columnatus]